MPNTNSVQLPHGGAAQRVQAAIRQGAQRTGSDFDFLLAQARIESSLDPEARAPTSSAAGLYQFINQTWLTTLKRHGAEHGYGWAADAITMRGGEAAVGDPALRGEIMQLRHDPLAASLMAGELAQDNAGWLEQNLGRPVDATELYLAHFLGAEGARKFIAAHEADPGQPAASLFPQAARANGGLFFAGDAARSLDELRGIVSDKLAAGGAAPGDGAFALAGGPNSEFSGLRAEYAVHSGMASAAMPRRASMAETLRDTFAAAPGHGTTDGSPAHVGRAYRRIARFGL